MDKNYKVVSAWARVRKSISLMAHLSWTDSAVSWLRF